MHVRPMIEKDIPVLDAMAAASGYPYPDLRSHLIEAVHVVVDDSDVPLCAVAAERITQLFFYNGALPPHAKLHALRLLHESLPIDLKQKGYSETNCFLPPEIESKFGQRLERSLGWSKNWLSLCRHF